MARKNTELELYQLKQFFLDLFFKEIWLITLLMITSFSIGAYFVYKKEKNFRVSGTIRLKGKFVGDQNLFPWIRTTANYDSKYIKAMIDNEGILDEILDDEKLNPEIADRKAFQAFQILKGLRLSKDMTQDPKALRGISDGDGSAGGINQSDFVLTFDTSHEDLAVGVLEAIIEGFIKTENDLISKEIGIKRGEFMAKKSVLQSKLASTVAEMDFLRKQYKSLSIEDDMEAIVMLMNSSIGKVDELKAGLQLEIDSHLKLKRELESRLSQKVDVSMFDASYGDLQNMLTGEYGQRDLLLLAYDKSHPKVRAITAKINRMEKQLKEKETTFNTRSNRIATDPYARTLNRDLKIAERKIEELTAAVHRNEKMLNQQKNRYASLSTAKAKIDSLKELESLLNEEVVDLNKFIEILSLNQGKELLDFSYLKKIGDPDGFNNAFKKYGYILSLLLALISTGGTLYSKYFFSGKFMRASEVPDLLPFEVFGNITLVRKRPASDNAFEDRKSHVAECFRKLRGQSDFFEARCKGVYGMFVTKSDGKTFVALNVAIGLAGMGKKVIVIDGDLRLPRMHQALNLENLLGFIDLLDDCSFEDVIQQTPIEGLDFIASGIPSSESTDNLHSERFDFILETLREEYDYVVFDTPPLAFSTDPYLMIKQTDFTLFVIAIDRTKVVNAERYMGELKKLGLEEVGIVVNRVAEVELFGQYSYRYYY